MEGFFLTIMEITAGMAVLILLLLPLLATYGKRFTARCRYILWILVLIRLAIPVSVGFLPALIEVSIVGETELLTTDTGGQNDTQYVPVEKVPENQTAETEIPANMDKTTAIEPVAVVPDPVQSAEKSFELQNILPILRIVYGVGAVVFLLWNLLSYQLYTKWMMRNCTMPDKHTLEIYADVCKNFEMKRIPNLYISPNATGPAAFGLFRQTIVLPDISFTKNGLVGTLTHEVVHCQRGDLWVKLLALVARSLHWFNPLVHLVALRCEMEMELSCDEAVLVGCDEEARAAYGEGMLDILRRCRQKDMRHTGALTTHFRPRKSAVKARLANIVHGTGTRKGYWLLAVCVVLCLVAGAAVACQTEEEAIVEDTVDEVIPAFTGEDAAASIPTMVIPDAIVDIAILEEHEVTETGGDGTNPIYCYELYEVISHTQSHEIGRVWMVSVFTQEEFAIIAEDIRRLHEIEPDLYEEDVYVSGYGHAKQVLGWDEAYVYVLTLPTDVQWMENDATSEANYYTLEESSTEMLTRFLEENDITGNPNCKARVYDPGAVLEETEIATTVDSSAKLTTILSDLQKDNAKAYVAHGTNGTKYPALGLESGHHYETEMEDYTFTAVEKLDNPKGDEYVLYSDPVGSWEVHGWYDSNHVMLVRGEKTYYFEAKHPSSGKFGKVLKWWFDLAEYEAAPYQSVFTEESYLGAAQAFADSYFGRRLHLTSGSRYAWSYVSCTVTGIEDESYTATLIEGGLIPENAYPYFLTVVFTYENPFAAAGGAADGAAELYTGDDPNVPQNAYQMQWCCYLTKEANGWHASPGGTGW